MTAPLRTSTPLPGPLRRWEMVAIGLVAALGLVLSLQALLRVDPGLTERFLRAAPAIARAARAFAADHEGRFPPDGQNTSAPPGLDASYIKWERAWRVDYETGPSPAGGHYVCLEFMGPLPRMFSHRLCRRPHIRRAYGKGQKIPGTRNRIWVIAESARLAPRPSGGPPAGAAGR